MFLAQRFSNEQHKPDAQGQGLVEYAFILALVALASIGLLLLLGPAISDQYCKIVNGFGGACEASLGSQSVGAVLTLTTLLV
jgi:Flp pilus assembly pilin Flp